MTQFVTMAYLGGGEGDEAVLRAAASIAQRIPSHVRALHVHPDPIAPIVAGLPEAAPFPAELVAIAEEESAARQAQARRAFDSWRAEHDLPLLDAPAKSGSSNASWTVESGGVDAAVARHGRLADLVIVPRDDAGGSEPPAPLETLLFGTGRPVLLVPRRWRGDLFGNAVIAWKSGAEAARAVGAALPLLERSAAVTIFAATERDIAPASAEDLISYLHWRGVSAGAMAFPDGAPSVGEALLAAAKHTKADLLVMGAYTTSRLRELVFGGVTRHVLQHAALPVLLAH